MLTTLVLLLLLSFIFWLYNRKSQWSLLKIPEVPGVFFLGSLTSVLRGKQAYFQMIEGIYNHHPDAPYVGFYQFFHPTLIVRDPQLIEKMLRDDARNFEDHGLMADPSDPLSMNLFYMKGKLWKWLRSKLRSYFSTTGMKTLYPDVQRCVDDFVENIGGKIDLRPTIEEFTCEVIAKAVFRTDSKDGFVEKSKKVFDLTGFSALRVLLRMFFPRVSLALGVKLVPQEDEEFFKRALRGSKTSRGSFLELLQGVVGSESELSELTDGQNKEMKDSLILGQFFIFILAGFETTATGLNFCLYNLAKDQDAQEKAREEARRATSDYGVSYEALKEMSFLENVINETLRLYTPVTSITRVCEADYRLPCGATLPAGTAVNFPWQALHRDPRYYREPAEFRPERWAEEGPKPFYPFGFGPRNCLGMQFAYLEMKAFLSTLLLKYSITVDESTAEPFEYQTNSFFIEVKQPVYLNVRPLVIKTAT